VQADGDVLPDRQVAEQSDVLEGAGDAGDGEGLGLRAGQLVLAEADAPPARPQHAGQQVEGGGLAGAVGADQAQHLAGRQPQRVVGQGDEAAEALRQSFRLQCGGSRRRHAPTRSSSLLESTLQILFHFFNR